MEASYKGRLGESKITGSLGRWAGFGEICLLKKGLKAWGVLLWRTA